MLQEVLPTLLKTSFYEMRKEVNTVHVGYVAAFDPATQLAQAQIGIAGIDAEGKKFTHSVIAECPVYFMGGKNFMIQHEVKAGDECIILFAQRCIDDWMRTGGIADQSIMRFHDKNDALIIVGLRSQQTVIQNFVNDGVIIRNQAMSVQVHVASNNSVTIKNNSGSIVLGANGDVNINGVIIKADGTMTTPKTITASGAVTAPSFTASGGGTMTAGTIASTGDVTASGISLKSHVHTGVTAGGSNTGAPKP